MIFTETDKKVMDIILKFKPIYEIIYKKTLKYKFNISIENIQLKDMNIQTENLETKQIEKHMGMIIGLLKDNTFTWAHPNLNRDHFKKNIEQMTKTYNLPKDVVNLLNKLCSADIIEFDEKYNEIMSKFLVNTYEDLQKEIRDGILKTINNNTLNKITMEELILQYA